MRYFTRFTFFLSLCLLAHPAMALDLWPFGQKGVAYKIELDGVPEKKLKNFMKTVGVTAADRDHPPQSMAEVENLAGTIGERYRKAMIAEGYYDVKITQTSDEAKKPARLKYVVDSGERYLLTGYRIDWAGTPLDVPDDPKLPPEIGKPATADSINNAGARFQDALLKKHCLLDLLVEPSALLDTGKHTALAVYRITPGAKANFGPTVIKGNGAVSQDVVRKYVKWKEGECYQATKVNDAKGNLVKSQLFASANSNVPALPDAKGEAPVEIDLKERSPHTVTLGGSYATDTGYGVNGHWEDRNFAGNAEKLTADATVSQLTYSAGTTYTIPYFYRDDQQLVLSGLIDRQTTDAYNSNDITGSAMIQRKLIDHLTASAGAGYLVTDVQQFGGYHTYGLAFIPSFLEWDSRSDTLDPKHGVFAHLAVTPYADTTGKGVSFLKTSLNAQTYVSAPNFLWEPTLAVRGALGSISGASVSDVPPSLRFYAGGGGSVRGYGYQDLGPQIDGEPVGGTSWTEVSGELRLKFNETIGAAAFIDGGNVYEDKLPQLDEKLFYGAGAGLRYYSPLGPIRFDVAVPLDKRSTDASYQLYVSVGQAF